MALEEGGYTEDSAKAKKEARERGEWIGTRWLLHKNAFPDHGGDGVDQFVAVTVIDARRVPGTYGKGLHWGLKAEGEDGEFYYCNWQRYPDDAMTPMWMWNSDTAIWYDATYVGHTARIPRRPKWLRKYKDFVGYCKTHAEVFYTRSHHGLCFDCFMEKEYGKPRRREEPKRATWEGW